MLVLDNYFAINVQFVDNNNALTLRTLAVGDTQAQHTSDTIRNLVEKVLKKSLKLVSNMS